MSPVKGSASQKDSFTFLSFLQCNRHSKSGSHDSGIGGDHSKKFKDNEVILISDDDSSNEPEFEMLCEVEFDHTDALPMPMEQKFIFKTEPESIQETNITPVHSRLEESVLRPLKDEFDTTVNLGECEEELLPLCKAEHGDIALNNNNYILFICPQCGIDFDSCSAWKVHIDSAHDLSDQRTFNFTQRPNNKFQCNKCQAIITRCTLKTLQQHHFTHLAFKVYKCKLCRHEERSLYLMISHIMLHKDKEELDIIRTQSSETPVDTVLEHESKQFVAYICPVCGTSFDNEDVWQGHINFKHNFLEKTAENRFDDHFKCTECNVEIFSQHVGDLQKHLFTHLPFKSFLKCKICNWTISRKNFMISHILNLHKTRLKRIVTTLAAADAVASNTDNGDTARISKSLPAVFNYDDDEEEDMDIADNVSEVKSNKVSVSMITESKPVERRSAYRKVGFRCVRCGNHFPTAAERNAHNVAEHGKYVCPKCHQNFAIKLDMKRHYCLDEPRGIDLVCPICNKEYNYEKCFQNHLRRCHRTKRAHKANTENQ